jgi:hypothetical protein
LGGAAQGARQVLNAADFAGPLGPRPRHFDHLPPQDRFLEHQPAILLAGGDEQRRSFAIGVVEHAQGVPQAARDVQIHNAKLPRGHREPVGHCHHRHFLQSQDILKAPVADEGVVQRHLRRAGIAKDMPHAELGEQIEKRMDSGVCHEAILVDSRSEFL